MNGSLTVDDALTVLATCAGLTTGIVLGVVELTGSGWIGTGCGLAAGASMLVGVAVFDHRMEATRDRREVPFRATGYRRRQWEIRMKVGDVLFYAQFDARKVASADDLKQAKVTSAGRKWLVADGMKVDATTLAVDGSFPPLRCWASRQDYLDEQEARAAWRELEALVQKGFPQGMTAPRARLAASVVKGEVVLEDYADRDDASEGPTPSP